MTRDLDFHSSQLDPSLDWSGAFFSGGLVLDAGTNDLHLARLTGPQLELSDFRTIKNPLLVYGPDMLTRVERVKAEPDIQAEMAQVFFAALPKTDQAILMASNAPLAHLVMGQGLDQLGQVPDKFQASPAFNQGQVYSLPHYNTFIGGDNLAALAACPLEEGELLLDLGVNSELVYRRRDDYYATSVECRPVYDLLGQVAEWIDQGLLTQTGRIKARADVDLQDFRLAKGSVAAALDILVGDAAKKIYVVGQDVSASDLVRTGFIPQSYADRIEVKGPLALEGLRRILLDGPSWPAKIHYLELSQVSGFYKKIARFSQFKLV